MDDKEFEPVKHDIRTSIGELSPMQEDQVRSSQVEDHQSKNKDLEQKMSETRTISETAPSGMTPSSNRKKQQKKKRREYPTEEDPYLPPFAPYQLSVSYMDSNGKKEALTPLVTLENASETPRGRRTIRNRYDTIEASPSQLRRVGSLIDLREDEGETIGAKAEKAKARRKRRRKLAKQRQRMKRNESKEELFQLPIKEEEIEEEERDVSPLAKITEITEPSEPYEETEEEYICAVAKTSLILPFTWKAPQAEHSTIKRTVLQWIEKLRERKYVDYEGEESQLWFNKEKLPGEVSDFTPQFRQVVGWRDKEKAQYSYQTWTCQRLIMNPKVVKSMFSNGRLCTIQGEKMVIYEADFDSVELLVYPMGSAILVFHVNWLPGSRRNETDKFTLDDMRIVLFASKYRHKVSQLCLGWNFYDPHVSKYMQESGNEKCQGEHAKCLGSTIFEAKYYSDKTVSLTTIGNWLVHSVGEDPSSPTPLLDYTRHAHHHSTVVVKKEPPSNVLQEYLFHLRRAFGQTNRPPPNPESSLGSVLVQRKNRYIGISREGTVCISWPIDPDDAFDFDLTKWDKKFQGVYLILALHVYGERSVLFELGDLAAAEAENLKLVAAEANFEEMKLSRQRLRELAALMVRYTLSMSSNDCGGSSEFSEFFTTTRETFNIPELRAELSSELKDVLAVVESNYLEEERRQRDEAETERRLNREKEAHIKSQKNKRDQEFNLMLSILSSFTLPFVIVSGIFGMNLHNLPESVDFWLLMGITFLISMIMFGLLVGWRWHTNRREKQDSQSHQHKGYIPLPAFHTAKHFSVNSL